MNNKIHLTSLTKLRDSGVKKILILSVSFLISYLVYRAQVKWIEVNCIKAISIAQSCKYRSIRLHVLPALCFFIMPIVIYIDKILLVLQKTSLLLESFTARKKWFISFVIAANLMAYIFFHRFTFIPLNPINNLWLQDGGDWNQNYLGWYVFKNAPWEYPFGIIKNLFYPIGVSIGYTDSIPALAFIFKIFRRILPDTFQYHGLWLFSCYLLQAFFASLIVKNWDCKLIYKIIATALLTCSTILLFRSAHITLNAHWLILSSIYLYFTHDFNQKTKIFLQSLILIFSAWVHPYFTFMISFLNIALLVKFYIEKQIRLKPTIFIFIGQQIIILLSWYFIGFFSLGGKYGQGNNYFNTNLNAFFNPMEGNSLFLSPLPVWGGQYEGFSYLGAGLIIAFLLIIFEPWKEKKFVFFKQNYPLIICVALLYIVALGNDIRFSSVTLLNYRLPDFLYRILSPFQACGRFAWPAWYLLAIFILYSVIMRERHHAKKMIFVLFITLLQFIDISPMMRSYHLQSGGGYVHNDVEQWLNYMGNNHNKILFYPPFQRYYNELNEYRTFWYLLGKYNYSINFGYMSRQNEELFSKKSDEMLKHIKNGEFEADAIYVTRMSDKALFQPLLVEKKIECKIINGFYACKSL